MQKKKFKNNSLQNKSPSWVVCRPKPCIIPGEVQCPLEGHIHQLLTTTAEAVPHESSSKEPADMALMQGAKSLACRVTSAGVFRCSNFSCSHTLGIDFGNGNSGSVFKPWK